jgi:hypothetical protein
VFPPGFVLYYLERFLKDLVYSVLTKEYRLVTKESFSFLKKINLCFSYDKCVQIVDER